MSVPVDGPGGEGGDRWQVDVVGRVGGRAEDADVRVFVVDAEGQMRKGWIPDDQAVMDDGIWAAVRAARTGIIRGMPLGCIKTLGRACEKYGG